MPCNEREERIEAASYVVDLDVIGYKARKYFTSYKRLP